MLNTELFIKHCIKIERFLSDVNGCMDVELTPETYGINTDGRWISIEVYLAINEDGNKYLIFNICETNDKCRKHCINKFSLDIKDKNPLSIEKLLNNIQKMFVKK